MSDETPLTPETEEKETAGAENNTQEAEIPHGHAASGRA